MAHSLIDWNIYKLDLIGQDANQNDLTNLTSSLIGWTFYHNGIGTMMKSFSCSEWDYIHSQCPHENPKNLIEIPGMQNHVYNTNCKLILTAGWYVIWCLLELPIAC